MAIRLYNLLKKGERIMKNLKKVSIVFLFTAILMSSSAFSSANAEGNNIIKDKNTYYSYHRADFVRSLQLSAFSHQLWGTLPKKADG